MKVLTAIKDGIVFLLGVIFFIFAIIMTILLLKFNDYGVSEFGATSLIIIPSEIANENYKKGDLVIVEKKLIEKYEEGQDIFTYRLLKNKTIRIEQGVIGKIYPEEENRAISFENGATFSEEFIAGVPVKIYHGIGTFLSVVESKWGFLFIVLVPSFLIFLYEVYALIIEIKYGKEEA